MSFILFLTVFFLPTLAYAWGPATHLEFGMTALEHLPQFLPWIRELLTNHANDFLYGSVAADITFGKKYTHPTRNCHNWSVGFELLERAPSDRQKAFMLGYLSHLAADTVSHNYFVPYYSLKSFRATSLRHTYWEVRMEAHAAPGMLDLISMFEAGTMVENDRLLERELSRTLFSFKINKRIFNALLSLQRSKGYQAFNQTLAESADGELSEATAIAFKALCMKAVLDLFSRYRDADCVRLDPTGQRHISYAREATAALKTLDRNRELSLAVESSFLIDVSTAFEQTLTISGRDEVQEPIDLPRLSRYLASRSYNDEDSLWHRWMARSD